MTLSNIFDNIGSKLIGLKFVGSSMSPDLWIGIIIECFHGFGNTHPTGHTSEFFWKFPNRRYLFTPDLRLFKPNTARDKGISANSQTQH